jgi:hypothetical protein
MEKREKFVALTQSNVLNGRINANDLMDFRNSELFDELLHKAGYNIYCDDEIVKQLLMSLNKTKDDFDDYPNALLRDVLYDELIINVAKKIQHWYFDCDETKSYRVVAHCADGDVEIKPKGKDTFSTLKQAVEARDGHLDLCDDIDIVELTNC